MTDKTKKETAMVIAQAELLGEWGKKLQEKDKRIKELEEDVVFLKKVIALCMTQSKNTVVYREIGTVPEFQLEENIGGETIIKMIRV
jgi:hypothetical protein